MDTFNNLPTPAKAGIALASGAGLMGAIALLTGGNTMVLLIIALGIVVVGALLVAYKFLLGWLGKRKAAPLERGILNNSAASPNSISEPARRARLDDLRRSFEGGVEKFRASGKNIYSLPWYVLVGEPGSGKTEAIRHCNVGFPPGLQDQLQGAGGTLNMNWWFTNHAIILDTAGRLMFEEVEPGGTSEWREFLTLLTKVRPNCPINGLLLVIPADSLIRDTADSIERKAGKIAQQLDNIQRQLGVRFPVFIVITKADLINGFREFFDTMSDPQAQHQIMGWSNPAPLDQPFSPEAVEKHLQTVSASLSKRRQGLLIDPVNTDDPNGRRIDQVDALYSFPESLLKIAPRLRRYLEMVFVAGEWSPKPLFLRGIYFTSSMREGSALDAELAEALKVPIESLPEGKVWERDRAYFLRDLFLQKVFKEKGLVTRASDTKKLQRRRKLAVIVSGIVGVFVLLGLTVVGAKTLDKRIGDQKKYWTTAGGEYSYSTSKLALFDARTKPGKYYGETKIDTAVDKVKIDLGDFHVNTLPILKDRIDVPLIFRPLSAFSGNINEKRATAYRAMFETSALQPLIKGARDRMAGESARSWNDRATAALAQLVRIETYAANAAPATGGDSPINLDPLARYVLDKDEDYTVFKKHGKGLQDVVDYLYTTKDGGGKWVPELVGSNTTAVAQGVGAFNAYWKVQAEGQSERLTNVTALIDALRRFKDAEVALSSTSKNPTDNTQQFNSFTENWGKNYTDLSKGKKDADDAVANLSKGDGWPEGKTLASVVETEVGNISKEAVKAYQSVIAHLPADDKAANGTPLGRLRGDLKDAQSQITGKIAMLTNNPQRSKDIAEADQFYLVKGKDLHKAQSRRYVIHYQVYNRADEQRQSAAGPAQPTFSTIAEDLKKLDLAMDGAVGSEMKVLLSNFTSDQERLKEACDTAVRAAELAAREKRYRLIRLTLTGAPQNMEQVAAAIARGVTTPLPYGKVPLTSFTGSGKFAAEYDPEAAKAYLSGWKALSALLDQKVKIDTRVLNTDELFAQYEKTHKPIEDYVQRYAAYWTTDLRKGLTVGAFTSWGQFFKEDVLGNQWEVKALSNILDIDEKARTAMTTIQKIGLPPPLDKGLEPLPELTKQLLGQMEPRYIRIVSNWGGLGPNPENARISILKYTPADFQSDFLAPADENGPLAEKYINQFGFQLLKVLANEANTNAQKAFDELKGLSHFPLALFDAQKNNKILTPEEVAKARVLFSKVMVPARNAGAAQQPRISDGALTRDGEVNKQLQMLCGLALSGADRDFMDQTEKLMAAIPPPDMARKAQCTVTALDQTLQNVYSSEVKKDEKPYLGWPAATICQDEIPQRRALMEMPKGGQPELLGTVSYPGGPIEFRVITHVGNQFALNAAPPPFVWPPRANNRQNFGGNWGAIFLINQPNSRHIGDHEWHVEIPIDAKTSLWVRLEFDKQLPDFPDLNKWPK